MTGFSEACALVSTADWHLPHGWPSSPDGWAVGTRAIGSDSGFLQNAPSEATACQQRASQASALVRRSRRSHGQRCRRCLRHRRDSCPGTRTGGAPPLPWSQALWQQGPDIGPLLRAGAGVGGTPSGNQTSARHELQRSLRRDRQKRLYNKPLQQTARPSASLRSTPVRPQLKGVVFDERRTSCAWRPGRDAGARRHGRRRARCAQPHRRPWRRRERDVLGLASGLARKGRAGR